MNPMTENPPTEIPNPRRSPHQYRTRNYRRFLEENGLLVDRILLVLEYMNSIQVDLPILLWAISWNVQELVENPVVQFMRTALMVSDELPEILANWHKPPRAHGAGTRTKAALEAMNRWAMETVMETIDSEMRALKAVMNSPQSNLTEESLLGISWQEMIEAVTMAAPITWKLFRHAAYTTKQEARNTMKDPDAVRTIYDLLLAELLTDISRFS